jgi:hypothetical protein
LFGGGGAKVGAVSPAPAARAASAVGGLSGFLKDVARSLTGVFG